MCVSYTHGVTTNQIYINTHMVLPQTKYTLIPHHAMPQILYSYKLIKNILLILVVFEKQRSEVNGKVFIHPCMYIYKENA